MSNHDDPASGGVADARARGYATTLNVRDSCLCLSAQRAARALARRFDEAFRPLGITSGQFSLLNALNQPEPPPMRAVAELLSMDRTTLTAALKPLTREGYVDMRPGMRDRRERRLLLLDEGRRILENAWPIWTAEHERLEQELRDDCEPDTLRRGLAILAG